jgi:hypothetical protein
MLAPLSNIHYPYIPAVNFTLAGITTRSFPRPRPVQR